jgi:HD superfamily phosphohydrolase
MAEQPSATISPTGGVLYQTDTKRARSIRHRDSIFEQRPNQQCCAMRGSAAFIGSLGILPHQQCDTMKELTHRDEVHGDVRFDRLAVALLNTPPLQRLGRIYQLAYSHLVYRGGTHTRLSHVMGAYHVAGKLVDALQKNYTKSRKAWPEGAISPALFLPTSAPRVEDDEDTTEQWSVLRYLVAWAALLHDLGHVPLGHTLEDEFTGIYEKHDAFASPRMAHLWAERAPGLSSQIREVFDDQTLYPREFVRVFPKRLPGPALIDVPAAGLVDGRRVWQTVLLICLYKGSLKNPTKFRMALDKADKDLSVEKDATAQGLRRFVDEVRQALDDTVGATFFPYMADIVGNTICADYLDYLRRDPQNLGLDILWDDRVISNFWVGRPMRFAPTGTDEQPGTQSSAHDIHMALSLVDRRGKPRLDTTTGVVELVRQRYRFAEIVYYHKTKAAASSMLAKVFQLIDAPAEARPEHTPISVMEVEATVADLLDAKKDRRKQRIERMKAEQIPSALLDPEVGDESMHLMLQYRAWETFEAAIEARESERAQDALRAFSLLKGIANRELYKVAFALTRPLHRTLIPGAKLEDTVNERLETVIRRLRDGDETTRGAVLQADLQHAMEAAADFKRDSILLYIPSLKAQAKGIETGALDRDGDVITLGEHTAVEEDVRELLRKYSNLWKFLVFVHPSLEDKAISLSAAVDTLLLRFYSVDQAKHARFLARHERDIQNACWFEYIPPVQRPSARVYELLQTGTAVDWSAFRRLWNEAVATGGNPEDLALHIQAAAQLEDTPAAWDAFKHAFPTAALLGKRVRGLTDERRRAAISGISPKDDLKTSLEEIVTNAKRFSIAPLPLAPEQRQLGLDVDDE